MDGNEYSITQLLHGYTDQLNFLIRIKKLTLVTSVSSGYTENCEWCHIKMSLYSQKKLQLNGHQWNDSIEQWIKTYNKVIVVDFLTFKDEGSYPLPSKLCKDYNPCPVIHARTITPAQLSMRGLSPLPSYLCEDSHHCSVILAITLTLAQLSVWGLSTLPTYLCEDYHPCPVISVRTVTPAQSSMRGLSPLPSYVWGLSPLPNHLCEDYHSCTVTSVRTITPAQISVQGLSLLPSYQCEDHHPCPDIIVRTITTIWPCRLIQRTILP